MDNLQWTGPKFKTGLMLKRFLNN